MANREPIGQPIRSLQTMLRTISQYHPEVLSLVPDGIYGGDTMASVASFQKFRGLPVTGITDIDTWYAVADEFRRVSVELGPAEPVYLVLQPGQVIHAGETNDHLYLMHGMMLAIGSHYPSMPTVTGGNVHDPESVAAVRWLQDRAGLEPNGDISRPTWRFLARLYRTPVGDGMPPEPRPGPDGVSNQSSP